jgi:Na+/alanine symporter
MYMLYRNTDEPDNPHGGPMWVAKEGFRKMGLGPLGTVIGGLFCITVITSAITGGNMFQSWNVGDVTRTYFEVPPVFSGIVLAIIVALVIIGGIKRIGAVAGRLVPVMCVLYLVAAVYVVAVHFADIPAMLMMIVRAGLPEWLGGSAVDPTGAFLGVTFGYAALWGIKRALFSSEAGQGSAPIAHSAAKTKEPVREGVVAGLEPFIDTLVVCTLTALVILSTGAWNRDAEAFLDEPPDVILLSNEAATYVDPPVIAAVDENEWSLARVEAPARDDGEPWRDGDRVFAFVTFDETDAMGDPIQQAVAGRIVQENGSHLIAWDSFEREIGPERVEAALYDGARPRWTLEQPVLPRKTAEARRILRVAEGPGWSHRETIFMMVHADMNPDTGRDFRRINGRAIFVEENADGFWTVDWRTIDSYRKPSFIEVNGEINTGVYADLAGAALTAHAFDRVTPGLGMWLVVLASWLFAISTMITWSYYGEQGMVYLVSWLPRHAQNGAILLYKLIYCGLIVFACIGLQWGFFETEEQLDLWTTIGLGVMLWVNIPIMLIFGAQTMRAYHDYIRRLKRGEMKPPHEAPPITDVVAGKDVE